MKKLTEKLNINEPEKPETESMVGKYLTELKEKHGIQDLPTAEELEEKNKLELLDMDKDEREDYGIVRQNLSDLNETGKEALEKLTTVAELTQEPRAYEVVAKLIQTLKETNESLYGLQEKRRKIKGLVDNKGYSNQPMNIEKAVFVGDPRELLDRNKYNTIENESDDS